MRIRTMSEVLRTATEHLNGREIETPRLNAELLLAHVMNCSRIQLYMDFEKPLAKEELQSFEELLTRRANREPLQYILGEAEFMGLKFFIDRRALIPRPETERLVEEAVSILGKLPGNNAPKILDIGTGSGNIAISIAKFVEVSFFVAIDASTDALDVARMNAKRHGVESRITVLHHDVFSELGNEVGSAFAMIVSNPPYISPKEFAEVMPEIRDHEPTIATLAGDDGLRFYRRICEIAPGLLSDGGTLLLETGYEQGEAVASLVSESDFRNVTLIQDYSGINRVVKGIR